MRKKPDSRFYVVRKRTPPRRPRRPGANVHRLCSKQCYLSLDAVGVICWARPSTLGPLSCARIRAAVASTAHKTHFIYPHFQRKNRPRDTVGPYSISFSLGFYHRRGSPALARSLLSAVRCREGTHRRRHGESSSLPSPIWVPQQPEDVRELEQPRERVSTPHTLSTVTDDSCYERECQSASSRTSINSTGQSRKIKKS